MRSLRLVHPARYVPWICWLRVSWDSAKTESSIAADALSADSAYPVTASWTELLDNEQTVELELIAGEPAVIDSLPLGTEVTLIEGEFDIPTGVTWEGATWSADSDAVTLDADGRTATIVVTGEEGDSMSMTLDNEFDLLPVEKPDPEDPKDKGELPWTGADVQTLAVIALLLIAAGIAAYAATRRKNARS